MERAEARLFADPESPLFAWQPEDLVELAREAGLETATVETREYADRRRIAEDHLRAWVFGRGAPDATPEPHSYAAYLATELSAEEREKLVSVLCAALCDGEIDWPTTVAYLEV